MEQNENYTIKEEKNCIHCGAVNDSKNLLCEKCGKSIYELEENNNNIGFSSELDSQNKKGKKVYMALGVIFVFLNLMSIFDIGIFILAIGLILYFASSTLQTIIETLLYAVGKFIFGTGIFVLILFGLCAFTMLGGA